MKIDAKETSQTECANLKIYKYHINTIRVLIDRDVYTCLHTTYFGGKIVHTIEPLAILTNGEVTLNMEISKIQICNTSRSFYAGL